MKTRMCAALTVSLFLGFVLAIQGDDPRRTTDETPVEPTPSERSNIKLSIRINTNPSDEYLLYLRQLGLTHVDIVITSGEYDRERLESIVTRMNENGFEVGSVNNHVFWARKSDPLVMGGEGREKLMEEYLQFVRDAAAVGFRAELISWRPSRVRYFRRPEDAKTTRGAHTVDRLLDPELSSELVYGRRYPAEEMWENFAWWAERAMPVAEETGLSVGVHTNAGVPEANGVAIPFHSRDCIDKAIEIADSPRFGLTLCTGVFATNPDTYGDIPDAVRYYGSRNRIFHAHFRNLSSPIPRYQETFPDNGYVDMHEVMRAFYEVGYDGTMIPDHAPVMAIDRDVPRGGVGIGPGAGRTYSIAYMRALIMALEKGWRPE